MLVWLNRAFFSTTGLHVGLVGDMWYEFATETYMVTMVNGTACAPCLGSCFGWL